MTRVVLGVLLGLSAQNAALPQQPVTPPAAQQQAQPQSSGNSTQTGQAEEEPPEEDEDTAPEHFVLNPLESQRNIRVGNYYLNKKKYWGAAERYARATRFDPNSPEAFFKLAEAQEKLKNEQAARVAYQRVVQLAPDSKFGREAKKKLSKS